MIGLFLLVAGAVLIWTGAAFAAGRAVGFVAGMRFERAERRRDVLLSTSWSYGHNERPRTSGGAR